MIRVGILGDIGSGKSYVSKNFGFPVFNADSEVAKLYKTNKKIYLELKKILPNYFNSFPIQKEDISSAILENNNNFKKIIKVVHLEVRKTLRTFLKNNKNKKIVILDIPLLLENKINKKNDILIFVQSKKSEVTKRLNNRPNFNKKLFKKFKKIQLPLAYKKNKSQFIIKNDFTKRSVIKGIDKILNEIK